MLDVRTLFQDDIVVLAAWGNLNIVQIRGAVGRRHLTEIVSITQQLHQAHPNGVVSLTFVMEGVPMPDGDLRSEVGTLMSSLPGVVRQMSIILDGKGIWASAQRTILRGMAVVARSRIALKVHDDLEDAARSLAPLISGVARGPTEAELMEAVQRHLTSTVASTRLTA